MFRNNKGQVEYIFSPGTTRDRSSIFSVRGLTLTEAGSRKRQEKVHRHLPYRPRRTPSAEQRAEKADSPIAMLHACSNPCQRDRMSTLLRSTKTAGISSRCANARCLSPPRCLPDRLQPKITHRAQSLEIPSGQFACPAFAPRSEFLPVRLKYFLHNPFSRYNGAKSFLGKNKSGLKA